MNVMESSWLREIDANCCRLKVKAQPNASKSEFIGFYGTEAVKIRIAAPANDGEANLALIEFLAEIFSLPKSHVVLLKGGTARHKLVEIKTSADKIKKIFCPDGI